MNRLCAAVLLFAVLFCLPRSAGAGEPLAVVSETELARIVHEGDGRPLVLVYWASWCVPCRHFREKLEKIRAGYPESELRMLAVSLDRDPGPVAVSGPDRGCGADQSPLGNARAHDHPVPPGRERGARACGRRFGKAAGALRGADRAPLSAGRHRVPERGGASSAAGKSVFPAEWEGVCSRAYPVPF